MLKEFFEQFGMNVMITLNSLPEDNEFNITDILIKYSNRKWYVINDDIPDDIIDIIHEGKLSDIEVYDRYKKYCKVIDNIYLYERLRISVACFTIEGLFHKIGLTWNEYKNNIEIENNIPTILNIDVKCETHTVLFYRDDDMISIINTYGGMGVVVTRYIPYEEYLLEMDKIVNSNNKKLTKFYISELFNIHLIYNNYKYKKVEKIVFNYTEREIIDLIIVFLTKLLPTFKERKDYSCLKSLIKDIKKY